MGWFDGLLGGGGSGGGVDYAGLLSGGSNIDYNKLLQQELANADNAKWGALAGALAEAGMPSRLPIPIGSAIGKAAAAFSGSDNNSLLKILQIQKLATETQNLKELSDLRKTLSAGDKDLMDALIKYGGAPGAGQPNAPAGDGTPGIGTSTGGGGGGAGGSGGTLTGEAIPIGQPGNPGSLAMEHPPEVQEQVAKKIATTSGLQHWAGDWNPKLAADLRAAGLPTSGPVTEEQWNAAKPMILARESMGGKNIPNYRFDAAHTAGGPFQITNSTFRAFGGPDIAAAANAAASDRPLPSAFNLPKFSGLLGESTEAEQPSIQAAPAAVAGVPLMSLPSQQEIGPPPNRARASPEAMRRAWPTGPGAPPLPPELGGPAPARTSMYPPPTPGQLATLAAMGDGDTMGGGDTEGGLVSPLTPGQGPLAIPRPAGLPPMPSPSTGGLLTAPEPSAAPFAGPGPLGTLPAAAPVAPPAGPVAPPALGPAPASVPGNIPAPNTQATQQLLAIIAQRRKQAALAGITGDPYGAYRDMILNSPRYLAEKAATERAATHPYALDEKRFGTDEELRAFLAKSPEERARIAIKADLDRRNALAGQGINLDPSGQATEIPGFGTTKATIEGQTADVQARIKAGQEATEINVPITDPSTGFVTPRKFSVTREEQGMYSRGEGIPRLGIPPSGAPGTSVAGGSVPAPAGAATPAPGGGGQGPLGGLPTEKPSEGYQWVYTPGGGFREEPIPGGKVAEAQQKLKIFNDQSANVLNREINRGLNLIDAGKLATTGPLSGIARQIPGTNAYQLNEYINTIETLTGLDRLAAMRQTSPSGAALGNVTEKEGERLARITGSLRQTQDPAELRRNLFDLHNAVMDTVHGTPAQRAEAVKAGKITQAQSDAIDREYYPVTPIPRPKSAGGSAPQSAAPDNAAPAGLQVKQIGGRTYVSPDGGKSWYTP